MKPILKCVWLVAFVSLGSSISVTSAYAKFPNPLNIFRNARNAKKMDQILPFTKVLESDQLFYRWGGVFEKERIGKDPAFDVENVNRISKKDLLKNKGITGNTKAGLGLYVADHPLSSADYAEASEDPTVIVVKVKKGSRILDLTNEKVLAELNKLGITPLDIYQMNPPPPWQIKFDSEGWWVLKSSDGVSVQSYSDVLREKAPDERLSMQHHIKKLHSEGYFPKTSKALVRETEPAMREYAYLNGLGWCKVREDSPIHGLKSFSESISDVMDSDLDSSTNSDFSTASSTSTASTSTSDTPKAIKPKTSFEEFLYSWRQDGKCIGGVLTDNKEFKVLEAVEDLDKCRKNQPTVFKTLQSHVQGRPPGCFEVVAKAPQIIVQHVKPDRCRPNSSPANLGPSLKETKD